MAAKPKRKKAVSKKRAPNASTPRIPRPAFIDADVADVMATAREADPVRSSFGLRLVNVGGAMERAPTFFWFRNLPQLVDFCFFAVPRLWEDDDSTDQADDAGWRGQRDELLKRVLRLKNAGKACEVVRDGLPGLGFSEPEWIGTFDELCSSDSDAAQEQRAEFWFRQGEGEGDKVTPIPRALRAEFATSLLEDA